MGDEIKNQTTPAGKTQETTSGENTQQEPVEAGGQSPEETPEFWLDEEGNLHGNFDDWGVSEEETGEEEASTGEEQASKEETQETQETSSKYYTPEELAKLELEQINPDRLPPELKPYYEALLKTHKDEAGEEITQTKQPTLSSEDLYKLVEEEAKKRVEARFGKFDELNPSHVTALAVEAAKLTQELERKLAVQRKIEELRAQEPYFNEINKYIMQKIEDLPAREYKKIMAAIQNDDFEAFYPFWEKMRKEFYQEKLGKTLQSNEPAKTTEQTQVKEPAPEPPKVEGAGKGEVETPPQINPRDFARMSEDEQAEALIKLGLV